MAHQRATNYLTYDDRLPGDYNDLVPLVTEALLKQVWLYHKQYACWFTPEEFTSRYSRIFLNKHDVRELQENLVLRDPMNGNAAFQKAIRQKTEQHEKEIAELTKKGEAFLNKVIAYYKSKNPNL